MSVHWVVIADSSRAQVFASDVMFDDLRPVETHEHPESRAKAHDLVSGDRGATHGFEGSNKSRLERHTEPHRATVDAFSREIADMLSQARIEHRFERLVMVAPPAFLGHLRSHLDRDTARTVVASLPSDWSQVPRHELPERIRAALAEQRSQLEPSPPQA